MSGGAGSAGLHVRAGNAMGRTRDGLLDGALACLERDGFRHTTMAGISVRSGVAKATLYNHFRTKPDVLTALVGREVDRIADLAIDQSGRGSLADALECAAAALAGLPAVRRLALAEPGVLAPLLSPGDGPGWQHARLRAAEVLAAPVDGPFVDLVVRWLAGQLLAPVVVPLRRATAELLGAAATAGIGARPDTEDTST